MLEETALQSPSEVVVQNKNPSSLKKAPSTMMVLFLDVTSFFIFL